MSKQEPVTHVVIFKLDKNKFRPVHCAQLLAQMRGSIPGMIALKFGPANTQPFGDYTDRSQGYTHVLVSKHVEPAALHHYQDHPLHIALVKYLRSVTVDKPLAIDVTSHL
ncbi:Hypothetical protein, putative [Bodo saltans]|uniref:Stress-response A/B barrel domain-containing protein n=1 Tax=Bodo saltans TaxID=75058 RepID=A0A0S4JUQ9_BODSA|nr:Hypothetical protein, putative [Bodo saltans]|eukprot:CUG94145.1 Hypothetical protein, putative [Bodo saltans]